MNDSSFKDNSGACDSTAQANCSVYYSKVTIMLLQLYHHVYVYLVVQSKVHSTTLTVRIPINFAVIPIQPLRPFIDIGINRGLNME